MLRTKLPFFLAYARARQQPIFIDYIESDGNQYIDTGLIGNFNTKAEVKFATNSVSAYPAVFGAREAANSKAFNVWGKMSSGYIGANISNKGGISSSVVPSVGTEYTVSLSNNQLVVNDNIKTFTGVIDFTTPTTMLLFDINGGGTHTSTGSNRPLNGRVYYLKVWEGDTLIQHLRPCLHPETFEACMYDTVTKQYFYNKGTGSFIPAPRFVEYIESTGTQWINIGIEATSITRFVVKGTCDTNAHLNTQLLGTNNNSATTFFGARYLPATGKKSWYCVNAEGVSIGNPTNLSIIDCTIESRTSQYGTLTDLIDNTISEFTRLATAEWGFTSGNLLLFGGAENRISPNATCYSLQLYTANGLVRDFRPCLRGNTPCMYDMVEGKYYMNAGTGTFGYGEIKFVDYIESTGTQWLLTDFYPTVDDEFVVDLQHLETTGSGDKMFFGIQKKDASLGCVFVEQFLPSYKWYVQFATTASKSTESTIKERTERITITINKEKFTTSDGTEIVLNGDMALNNTPLTIFNQISSSGANRCSKLRMWSFYVLRDGSKVLDLRPALDYNNVACMYDMITGKYFYNQGTGEFIAGGKIV
jgi:hypothetical protein